MSKKRPAKPLKRQQDVYDIQDYLKYRNERNYIIFLLGITTGYRAGDLVRLKARDIRKAIKYREFEIEEGKLFNNAKVREKKKVARKAELLPELSKILKDHIKEMKDYEYIFKSRKGLNQHIGVPAVSNALKEAGLYFGLYDITAHSMRKTYAYKIWIESEKNTLIVKEMLGHETIEETKKYLGLDKEEYHKYTAKLSSFVR